MKRKSLLLSLAAGLLIGFGACKKEKKVEEEVKKDEVVALKAEKKQRAFMGYVGATWCPPCGSNGGPGFKKFMETYSEDDFVGLYIPPSGETVPYASNGTKLVLAGFVVDFSAAMKSTGTIPYYNVNGSNVGGAYSSPTSTFNAYKPKVDQKISTDPELGVAAKKTLTSDKLSCEVAVEAYKGVDGEYFYSVLALEKSVIGFQIVGGTNVSNYEHKYLARASLIGDGTMSGQKAFKSFSSGAIAVGKTFSETFSLTYENYDITGYKLVKWNYTPDNTLIVVTIWKKEADKYLYVNSVVAK